MEVPMKTGAKVKRYRRGNGLSQVELAEASGVAQSTIAQIENGNIEEPRPRTLVKLAEVLGVTPMDLLDDLAEQ
jgi:transcriptional regulator with XRE-family HTH domain